MRPILRQIKKKSLLFVLAVPLVLSGCGDRAAHHNHHSASNKQAIIQTAKKMLGVKYFYGGATPTQGFDCSGFVQYSHKLSGVQLPRTTGQQYKATKPISRKYLKAGDLVFFKTSVSRLVSHVGIYLGNNSFIHAPSSGKHVKISSMKNRYWSKRYIGAGRVL